MTITVADPLVSAQWLSENFDAPDLRIIEATWYVPGTAEDGKARRDYDEAHIPGARFFDIDEISQRDSPYSHTLPDTVQFASQVRKLAIGDGNRIVVYDRNGFMASARVWWMLRTMGLADVMVLDGGFSHWTASGLPIEDMPPVPMERHFTPRLRSDLIKTFEQMQDIIAQSDGHVFDARPPGRFSGETPEPREGVKAGHMPGAVNVPAASLIDAGGKMKPAADLYAAFGKLSGPITTSCGSGVTAATLALALARIGQPDVAVYDGSWAEWGSRSDTPIDTGASK